MPDVIIPDPNLDPNPGEINVLRRQTKHYIKANPSDVVLVRSTSGPDGAGGTIKSNPQNQPAITVRIIQAEESSGVERRNVDGETVQPNLNMLCEWDAGVKVGDTFTYKDMVCEVVYVTDMNYELTCEVVATNKVIA